MPLVSDLKRTPISTDPVSVEGPDSGVVAASQMVQGQVFGGGGVPLVVKDQLKSLAMALPASSLTPDCPPLTVAV